MSTTTVMTAAVLTVSDGCAAGTRTDTGGPALAELLTQNGFTVELRDVVPDEEDLIKAVLIRMCGSAQLVVTTGGTGLAPRDVTPEATLAVCDKTVPGLAEMMRAAGMKSTKFAALGRGVCGARGKSLIINLPGSPKGAVESLNTIIGLLPHALDLLKGKTEH